MRLATLGGEAANICDTSLGGLYARWLHLGGCADLAIMAGSGVPCPEGKPLKVRRPVSSAGFQLPAAGLTPATALESRNRRETTMQAQKAIEAPRESPDSFAALAAAVHPDWHDAIQRLANAITCVSCQIDEVLGPHEARRSFQARCGDLVTNLIDLMDRLGPDPDREPDDDEPSLGWTERGLFGEHGHPNLWDREQDDSDDEPSLASPEKHPRVPYTLINSFGEVVVYGPEGQYRTRDGSQARWADGSRSDLEEQCDDEGVT